MSYKNILNIIIASGLTTAIFSTAQVMRNAESSPINDELYYCDSKWENCVLDQNKSFDYYRSVVNAPKSPLPLKYALNNKEVYCLAQNIFHEAGSHGLIDQLGVAFSTINRVKDQRFPDSLCAVIRQNRAMSWQKNKRKRNMKIPSKFQKISRNILLGNMNNPLNIPAVGWGNAHLDSARSFNFQQMRKVATAIHKPKGAYHVYIAY